MLSKTGYSVGKISRLFLSVSKVLARLTLYGFWKIFYFIINTLFRDTASGMLFLEEVKLAHKEYRHYCVAAQILGALSPFVLISSRNSYSSLILFLLIKWSSCRRCVHLERALRFAVSLEHIT